MKHLSALGDRDCRMVVAADLDGDGGVDLATIVGNGEVKLFIQTAPAVFATGIFVPSGDTFPGTIVSADLDAAGDRDFVGPGGDANTLTLSFNGD